MRAGARLKTVIQRSNKLRRADPEKTTGVSVFLGLNTDEPAQIQPPESRMCGWANAARLWALCSAVRTTRTAALKDKAL